MLVIINLNMPIQSKKASLEKRLQESILYSVQINETTINIKQTVILFRKKQIN